MADVWNALKRVQYECPCGQFSPLVNLYFCRHCLEMKCQECVFILPEYLFCPHCFDSAAGSDLKNKKYQCNHCFKCPSCATALSVQQYTKSEEDADKDGKASKAYYLTCLFCQWSSQDVGIPDGASPLDFKEPDESSKTRMEELVAHYKKMTLVDREEREKKRRAAKKMMKSWSSLLDPSPGSKLGSLASPGSSSEVKLDANAVSTVASSEVDSLPEHLYSSSLDINQVTTIEQRLAHPARQPESAKDLWPRPFPWTAKRLRRCGKCDHMICRAEYNPSSVRYKIQQIARSTVPQVKIKGLPEPKPDKAYTFVLSLVNPTSSVMTVSFEPVKEEGESALEATIPTGEFHISASDDVDVLDIAEDKSNLEPEQAKFLLGRGVGEIYLQFTTPAVHQGSENKVLFVMSYSWSVTERSSDSKMMKVTVCVDLGDFAAVPGQ
uniref:Dynactin subunit 4 n=1 Tax=Halisarca dujardinii TaxID=2583056 RepID=A0A9F1U3Z5_HALDU|nr:dynactin 4 [Halisarca dujardinii]